MTRYPGFRIETITAFTTIGDDDEEGVLAFLGKDGFWIPMVAANPERLEDLRRIAAEQFAGTEYRERKFVAVDIDPHRAETKED